MHPVIVAAAVKWQPIVVYGVILLVFGGVYYLAWKRDPFRRLERYRVKRPSRIRFESLGITMVGNTPTNCTTYRNSLSYAMDDDWVYFRHKSIPFMPTYWKVPRREVRRQSHFMWTIRIDAADPPLHAAFDEYFVRRLKAPRN